MEKSMKECYQIKTMPLCRAENVIAGEKYRISGADLKYTKQGNASANYVKVADDGTVYVAYGRAGVKALRFTGM